MANAAADPPHPPPERKAGCEAGLSFCPAVAASIAVIRRAKVRRILTPPPRREDGMNNQGSCHCGNVKYEVEGEIDKVIACNCSMCQRKGSLLWFAPIDKFTRLTPESNEKPYLFNKHRIEHRFCTNCGMHSFAIGINPKGEKMAAINVRCIEDIDLDKVPVTHYDGRKL
jgi:hypothetical protein